MCEDSSTNIKETEKKKIKIMCHQLHIICHMSPGTCHKSPVISHLSPVTCHLSPPRRFGVTAAGGLKVDSVKRKILHFVKQLKPKTFYLGSIRKYLLDKSLPPYPITKIHQRKVYKYNYTDIATYQRNQPIFFILYFCKKNLIFFLWGGGVPIAK